MADPTERDLVSTHVGILSSDNEMLTYRCSHIPDNHEVTYRVFLRGLQKYAGAQMRFGS